MKAGSFLSYRKLLRKSLYDKKRSAMDAQLAEMKVLLTQSARARKSRERLFVLT